MIPTNKAERSKAFRNFLLFFMITIGVIVAALIFSFQVPFKENEKLRKDMDVADNEKAVLQSFEVKMQETMNLLDSVNLSVNAYRINDQISTNIKSMGSMLNDTSSVNTICNKILYNLSSLQRAKEQLRNVNTNNAEMEKRDNKIEQLQNKLNECTDKYNNLLLSNNK